MTLKQPLKEILQIRRKMILLPIMTDQGKNMLHINSWTQCGSAYQFKSNCCDYQELWNLRSYKSTVISVHASSCLWPQDNFVQLSTTALSIQKKALAIQVSIVSTCLNVPTSSWATWDTMVPFKKERKAVVHEVGVTCACMWSEWHIKRICNLCCLILIKKCTVKEYH